MISKGAGELCTELSPLCPVKNTITFETARQATDGERLRGNIFLNITDVAFQGTNVCSVERALPFPESTDVLLSSPDSSMSLTDALLTTNTMSSSTFSSTPVLQNSKNVFAMLWEGGVRPNLLSFKDDDIFITRDAPAKVSSPFVPPPSVGAAGVTAPETLSSSTGSKDDCGFLPASSGMGKPLIAPPREDGTFLSGMCVQPCTKDVHFLELPTKEIITAPNTIGGVPNARLPSTLSATVPSPSGSVNSDEGWINDSVAAEEYLSVVDPQRTRLRVLISAIEPTKALERVVRHPSLCLLFQSGRCRQGANCYQAHVDPTIIKRLRQDAGNLPLCCTFHGDCNAVLWDAQAYACQRICLNGVVVPLNRIAYTSGLSRLLMRDAQRPLSIRVICRLHGKPGGCRYGADCWYIHVCREIMEKEFSSIPESPVTSLWNGEHDQNLTPSARKGVTVISELQGNSSHLQHQIQLGASSTSTFFPLAGGKNFVLEKCKNANITTHENTSPTSIFPPCIVSDLIAKNNVDILPGTTAFRNTGLHNNNNPFCGDLHPGPRVQAVFPHSRVAAFDNTVPMTVGTLTPGVAFASPMLDTTTLTPSLPMTQACYLLKPTSDGMTALITVDSPAPATYATIWPSHHHHQQQPQQMWNRPQYWNPSVQLAFVSSLGRCAPKGN